MIRLALTVITTAVALISAAPAGAQTAATYPNKPVHMIVPATAGGSADFLGRLMAAKLGEALGQTFVVENRAGAGTNIGNEYVAKAAPDGYTLLMNGFTLATNRALFKTLPYDPIKDFAPVIQVAGISNVVAVTPESPIKSFADLIAAAKKSPGTLNYGSPANGSSVHLTGVLLQGDTGIDIVHLAYRGSAQSTTDLIGGSLQFGFVNMPVALPFVKSGKLRALAVTSAKRSALLPDVPTVAELLGKPFELTGWFGILAPAGTPPDIVAKINAASVKILATPEVQAAVASGGADIVGGSAADFTSFIKNEEVRMTKALQAAGVKPE